MDFIVRWREENEVWWMRENYPELNTRVGRIFKPDFRCREASLEVIVNLSSWGMSQLWTGPHFFISLATLFPTHYLPLEHYLVSVGSKREFQTEERFGAVGLHSISDFGCQRVWGIQLLLCSAWTSHFRTDLENIDLILIQCRTLYEILDKRQPTSVVWSLRLRSFISSMRHLTLCFKLIKLLESLPYFGLLSPSTHCFPGFPLETVSISVLFTWSPFR